MNRWLATTTGLLLSIGLTPAGHSAPQTFNTALPVAKSEFVFREQLFRHRASDDPSAAARDLEVLGSVSVLGAGIFRNLVIFGVLPYHHKTLDLSVPGGALSRGTSGLADARVFGRYTVYQNNAPGRTFRIAPFLGVELPTGDDNDSDSSGRLPATLQLGSGSWDPFAGAVLTYQTLRYQFDVQASYKINTQANDFEFGDEARLDASFQYRLVPRVLDTTGVPGYLYGVLEGSVVHHRRNSLNGVDDPNSGGTSWFIAPGVQFVTRRWILEGIVQLPLTQDLHGLALAVDYTVRVGFRVNF